MDASHLFRTQLFLLSLFGFSLDYQNGWRGNLKKFYAFCVIISDIFIGVLMLHFITFANYTLEEVCDACGGVIAVLEVFVKLILFYKWRLQLKMLFHKMDNILNSGNSISSYKFNKIAKTGTSLTKLYVICTLLTADSSVFGALYKMNLESERVLPFKLR